MGNAFARRLAAGAVVIALGAVALHNHYARPHVLTAGDRLIPISVTSLDGESAVLSARGHAQLINVFATWCPPCRDEMPAFTKLAGEMRGRNVDVIGIDQQEDASVVTAFARDFGVRFPLYIDSTNITHDVLGARMIPTTIYVDAGGVIRWERHGPLSADDYRELAAVLGKAG